MTSTQPHVPAISYNNRVLAGILIAALVGLVGFSAYLAGSRIYQVDECMEVYVARMLNTGEAKTYAGAVSLLQFPLAWSIRVATKSAEYFTAGRLVMLVVFWVNLTLLAVATGEKLLSRRGLLALLGAATLAPLWDYGFEIRHDNLMLTGLLLMWCVTRVRPGGVQSYFLAGALVVGMQFAAHKAFAYTIPLSLAILVFPPRGHNAPRWKLILAWAIGAVFAVVVLRLFYGAFGVAAFGAAQSSGVSFVSGVTAGGSRFGPGISLVRLLTQTPLLLALAVSALVVLGLELRRRGRAALTWEGHLPEALLFLGTLGILCINPTPFPYNLLHLVPYAFLFAYLHASRLVLDIRHRPVLVSAAVALLIFAHLGPFAVATWRHVNWSNARQVTLMNFAEQLTDPTKDPVFDGIGMVPTRPVIDPASFLHSLTMQSLLTGGGAQIRDMLAERPAAVIIQSYRTSWLPEEDHEFIRERYVPLADDFWVLGSVLPAGGGEFEIHHPGRYHIAPKEESNLEGTFEVGPQAMLKASSQTDFVAVLNGRPLTNRTVEMSVGVHRLETGAGVTPTVVWTGPRLKQAPRIGQGSPERLFVNWY